MARMHSRKHGSSGSKKPVKKSLPVWLRYQPKEVELIIAKLVKEGRNASEIGSILRDTYGIPDIRLLFNKKLSQILKDKNLSPELPDDLNALISKSVTLRKHLEENHQDEGAKRGLLLTESKIKRLTKYYKRAGKLSEDWKYDPARARIMTK